MRIRRPWLVAALPLIALAIVAGGEPAEGRGLASTPRASATIRVGYFPNVTHAQAILGFGEHAFARDLPGADVQGKVFNAGPDELNALFAGAIDIGYIGPGPAINGFVRSQGGLVIVAGAASGGSILVARAGAGIKSVKDLAGKKVSVPQLGNTQDILLRSLLGDAGLRPSEQGGSVRIIAVQNPDTLTLFQKGDLDAALVPEPWGTRLVASTNAGVVLDWQQIYGGTTPATVIVASASFARVHPDLIVRFLRVHRRLTNQLQLTHAHEDSQGIEAVLNAQIKVLTGKALPNAVLEKSLTRTVFNTGINQTALTQFAAYSVTAGYLKRDAKIGGIVDAWPLAHLNDTSIT